MAETDKKLPPKSEIGQYPYNLVTVYPDGREIHINYTPNNFSTRYWTPIGTAIDIDKNGRLTIATQSNQYQYSKGGIATTSDTNIDIKSSGAQRNVSDGGSHNESGSATTNVVNGSATSLAKEGSITSQNSGHSENVLTGNQITKVSGDIHLRIEGDDVKYLTGSKIENIQGEQSIEVAGNGTQETKGKYKMIIGDKLIIECSSLEIISSGIAKIQASGIQLLSSTLTHNGKDIGEHHKHTGVTSGGDQTGEPV